MTYSLPSLRTLARCALPALVDEDVTLSWSALAGEIARAAAWLDGLARRSIDASPRPLALVADAHAGAIVLLWAAFERGRPVLLLHPRAPADEHERLRALVDAEPLTAASWGARPWRHTPATQTPAPPYDARPAVFVATSGTSGAPKLVALSRRALAAAAQLSSARLCLPRGARWLLSLPYAHVGGLGILLRARARAGCVVCSGGSFDAAGVHAVLRQRRITHVSLTPTQLARFVAADLRPPRTLAAAILGGAACPPAVAADARRLGWPLVVSYGMTETAGMIAATRSDVPGASGRALPGVTLRVAADGRLAVRTPTRATGYVGAPRVTGTWWRTADRAHLDAAGNLHLDGRADDVVSCGGEKVSPSAVEAALARHPDVRAACVWADADAAWGHTLSAVVEARDADATALAAWARAHLAPWQRPRRLRVVAALPLTPGGKLDRQACRRLAT